MRSLFQALLLGTLVFGLLTAAAYKTETQLAMRDRV